MASRYFTIILFFCFFFKSLIADSNPSFSLKNFSQNSNIDSYLSLYGDAKVVNGGSLQITALLKASAGRVSYKTPIKILGGTPKKLVSFSTYFSFSISSNSTIGAGGLAFFVFPNGYPVDLFDVSGSFGMLGDKSFNLLRVEFDSFVNDTSTFVYVKLGNISSSKLVLKRGEKMQSWIDYQASSRRLEVRLTEIGHKRPLDPFLFAQIDLSKTWAKSEIFFVGLSSSNGNSSQTCYLYSWSFKAIRADDWVHSQPLDPMVFKEKEEDIKVPKESHCVFKILAALILGIGFGAFGSLIVMFLWTILGCKKPIVPEELSMKSVEECELKKPNVVLEKASSMP